MWQLAESVADSDPAAFRPAVDAGVRVAGVRLQERRRGCIPAVWIGGIDGDRHHVPAVEAVAHGRPGRAAVVGEVHGRRLGAYEDSVAAGGAERMRTPTSPVVSEVVPSPSERSTPEPSVLA